MAREAWRLDRKLTAMMVEDMIFDPILAGRVLLRVDLPPHEELRIGLMWTNYFTNDDSGFSTGKSWTLAYVCALRQALFKDRISGIISKTFVQGQLIFKNIEKWVENSPILRSCMRKERGNPKISHASTGWVAYWKGGGETRVLPPNFMQDAERLRSERWNDMYGDEWTTYGNFTALNKTVIGRVTRINDYNNTCMVRGNHIHLCSTPQFKHHPSYQMIQFVQGEIDKGNDTYKRFTANYRHVPDGEFSNMVDKKAINHMQRTLPKSIVRAEIEGFWEDDTGTYYNSDLVTKRRCVTPVFEPSSGSDIYIGAFDVARGGADQTSGNQQGDDFAFTVLGMPYPDTPARHILTIRKNKVSSAQMAAIIHELHSIFRFRMIGYDPGGGGLFVRDDLRKKEHLILGRKRISQPIIEFQDTSGTIGDKILVPIRRGDPFIAAMLGKMASDSILVNQIHHHMKVALISNMLHLAVEWEGWSDSGVSTWDVSQKRKWLNQSASTDEQMIAAESDLAVSQLMLVDVDRDAAGNPILDSYGMYSFESEEKKDAAYSLCYANFIRCLYNFLNEHGFSLPGSDSRRSSVVCAVSPIIVN